MYLFHMAYDIGFALILFKMKGLFVLLCLNSKLLSDCDSNYIWILLASGTAISLASDNTSPSSPCIEIELSYGHHSVVRLFVGSMSRNRREINISLCISFVELISREVFELKSIFGR